MKKKHEIRDNSARRAERENLSNKSVTITAATVLYALLIIFLQNMSRDSLTVLGAQAFIQILFWGSIVGAMVCAALGAYKEKKGLFMYCGVFVYIIWSVAVIQYCGTMGSDKAYALVYVSLAMIFIMTLIFGALAGNGKFAEKRTVTAFTAASLALFVLFCVAAVLLRFRFFGLLS